jgi:hypothetical protein
MNSVSQPAGSYEYHGFDDNGNYNWGSGTQKVPMTESRESQGISGLRKHVGTVKPGEYMD